MFYCVLLGIFREIKRKKMAVLGGPLTFIEEVYTFQYISICSVEFIAFNGTLHKIYLKLFFLNNNCQTFTLVKFIFILCLVKSPN